MCSTCGCKGAEESDISKNIFGNMRDAKKRAKQLGTKQIHSHDLNGDKVFMPFKTHQEYQKNMGAESSDSMGVIIEALDYINEPDIDDDSYILSEVKKILEDGADEDDDSQNMDYIFMALNEIKEPDMDDDSYILGEVKKILKDASSMNAESFEAESNFDKLANKIAAQYRAKGKSPAEAERIGKATAAKIGFKKYGKAGMRTKAMRGRMAKGAEGTGGKKSMIPTVITFGVLGVVAYLATKIKSVEFGADGDCGCGCKGAKVGGCGDTKKADEGHYPETFDPVQDWLPRYRYPEDSDWSNSYNPADPYRPLDYQTVQVDSKTTVDKMGMI